MRMQPERRRSGPTEDPAMPHASEMMRLGVPTTYYLLRSRNRAAGHGAYVGLAPRGAHAIVAQPLQARRFSSIDDAQIYLCTTGRGFGDFEIEARLTE
jgi:hypothetical protein